jgi:DNA-binding PadR family transcriptional regulator
VSVRYGLLGLLRRAPAHGYQLWSEFEAVTGAAWPLNIGQVYSTLQRLERTGLVAAEGSEGSEGQERRRYRLTEQGSQELDRWFASPLARPAHSRSELVVKVAVAMSLPDVDVRAVLDAQRAETMSDLQSLTQSKRKASGDAVASLALDALVFSAEAEIRWLDHCEAGLRRATRRGSR